MSIALLLAALASAALYLRRRAWLEAVLVLLAGAALAALLARLSQPASEAGALRVTAASSAAEVAAAARLRVDGDGLPGAVWRDLPARPLDWQAPATPSLQLDFPRQITLGRSLRVALTRSPAVGEARLQLLAENGQLLSETRSKEATLALDWLAPVAEDLVLRLRLLDAAGKTVAEGPLPVRVLPAVPLQARGRLYAPSFDANALNRLLTDSGANIDWEVTLGKDLRRSETPKEAGQTRDLLLLDAAWFEHAPAATRQATLAQVAQGASLIILGANASDAAVWSASLQLGLRAAGETALSGAALSLSAAALAPQPGGPWQAVEPGIVARDWQQGRIVWLGVADWHRHAISEPQQLGRWWQGVLDAARVQRMTPVQWLTPASMPLAGQRSEICAIGVQGEVTLPQLQQTLSWQARPELADARCIAVWPRSAGWLELRSGALQQRVYVFGADDWPQWQAAERRTATQAYQARTPQAASAGQRPLPAWPFAVLAALALCGLWWRERGR
ncbi:hypothetical protein [Massilia sp. TS11]|uniref:hypothetical protein n=1 Tax=Massilia sp. TS11 TaxID=2908003 RepID=UPI001EDC3461|nr:hypothetical protein [Massilia sp. TS11]MCG2584834.1 hypothetical protein [Massilia sp. TS11]